MFEMQKVYIVSIGDKETYAIKGVFTTVEVAKEYIKAMLMQDAIFYVKHGVFDALEKTVTDLKNLPSKDPWTKYGSWEALGYRIEEHALNAMDLSGL